MKHEFTRNESNALLETRNYTKREKHLKHDSTRHDLHNSKHDSTRNASNCKLRNTIYTTRLRNIPELFTSRLKMIRKSFKCHSKYIQQLFKRHSIVVQKSFKIDPKRHPRASNGRQSGPKWPQGDHKDVQRVPKVSQRGPRVPKSHPKGTPEGTPKTSQNTNPHLRS